jgi:hypothetical protein
MLRAVVVVSLATGVVLDLAYGPVLGKETGETALLRQLLAGLTAGDILLADRYYCNYWLVALAQARDVDVVFRLHQLRDYDFRRGERLGHDDHVVVWHKPQRPEWMDRQTYAAMPEVLVIRELRYAVDAPGCRTDEVVIATTLTQASRYSKEDIAALYQQRWQVEPDLCSIKESLHLDHLRCRTPAMIDKELWAHMLGYNLLRKISAQAALVQASCPREVSFRASQQTVTSSWSQLTLACAVAAVRQGAALLSTLGRAKVGQRPGRYEPRRVKRAPKPYKRLRWPRAQARARLLTGRQR